MKLPLNTVGNDKTWHPDLLATRGSERSQRGTAGVTDPLSTSPSTYAVHGHLSGWGDGSRAALPVPCRSALQAAACIPWCWCCNPSFPKSHSPAERRTPEPSGCLKSLPHAANNSLSGLEQPPKIFKKENKLQWDPLLPGPDCEDSLGKGEGSSRAGRYAKHTHQC